MKSTDNGRRRLATTGILLLALTAGPLLGAKDELPQVSHDGLRLLPDTEVAAAYVKPDADFSGYQRIMLLDASVAFRKNWARDQRSASVPGTS